MKIKAAIITKPHCVTCNLQWYLCQYWWTKIWRKVHSIKTLRHFIHPNYLQTKNDNYV